MGSRRVQNTRCVYQEVVASVTSPFAGELVIGPHLAGVRSGGMTSVCQNAPPVSVGVPAHSECDRWHQIASEQFETGQSTGDVIFSIGLAVLLGNVAIQR